MKLYVVSCAPRAAVLAECLASVRASDWTFPVEVVYDHEVPENASETSGDFRSNLAIREAILRGVCDGDDQFVILEDDALVNRHLLHNLRSWQPLAAGWVGYGALTTNEGNRDVWAEGDGWYAPDSRKRYGLVGALLTRPFAAYALSRWADVPLNADLKLARLGGSNRAGQFFVHWPSLVLHRHDLPSVCGHAPIVTDGFDAEWRAEPAGAKAYARRLNEWSDIRDHLPALFEAATGSVLELGVRGGVSTSALLAGVEARGGHVWSVDRQDCSAVFAGHPRWTFIRADSLEAKGVPDVLDLLFIDTEHTEERTLAELRKWGPRSRVIMLHDTDDPATFPGVRNAIETYCRESGRPAEHRAGSNGLGVIR